MLQAAGRNRPDPPASGAARPAGPGGRTGSPGPDRCRSPPGSPAAPRSRCPRPPQSGRARGPSPITARTIAASSSSSGKPRTSERSSFITVSGSLRSIARLAKPMPKSSSARPTPWSRKAERANSTSSSKSISMDSVSSSSSRSAGRPESSSARRSVRSAPGRAAGAGETLTETVTRPGHVAASRQRGAQHPAADAVDEAGLLGERDEGGRGDEAAPAMRQARAAPRRRPRAGGEREARLVVQHEAVPRDRRPRSWSSRRRSASSARRSKSARDGGLPGARRAAVSVAGIRRFRDCTPHHPAPTVRNALRAWRGPESRLRSSARSRSRTEWIASRPERSRIWCRQEVPSATMKSCAAAARTAGSRPPRPSRRDVPGSPPDSRTTPAMPQQDETIGCTVSSGTSRNMAEAAGKAPNDF